VIHYGYIELEFKIWPWRFINWKNFFTIVFESADLERLLDDPCKTLAE